MNESSEYFWKQQLEGLLPMELFPKIEGDGFNQQGKIVWNEKYNRIEIFPPNGGWIGLNEDGSWQFDIAPFSD